MASKASAGLASSLQTGTARLLSRVSTRSCVMGTKGMVACSQPLAAEAGLEILKRGGSAMDAAVCVGACLSVLEPCSTGIGGDGFYLHYNAATKAVTAANGSGRAPAALTLDAARAASPDDAQSLPTHHAHTVTVPGLVAMWCDALDRHGSGAVSRADVLARSVELAREGFPVAPVASSLWANSEGLLKAQRNGGELLTVEGRAPAAGELFKREGLAEVLELIRTAGKAGFYAGRVAEAVVAEVQEQGGVLSLEDLAAHETTFSDSISSTYGGVNVHGHPPNGQGITALIALNILEHLEETGRVGFGREEWGSTATVHAMVEALRLAFADARHFVGDPAVSEIPVAQLLSKEYAARRAELFDPAKAAVDVREGQPLKDSCTVSFQVVDSHGNAVSMVNSTYMGFGTCMVPKGTGFTLQNRGVAFSLDPTSVNCIAPGKRPYHTIIPCITTDAVTGELHTTFTNMGGYMQPQGHVQHLINMLRCKMDPQESIDLPRFCILNDQYSGVFGRVAFEPGFREETLRALRDMGHDVYVVDGLDRSLLGRAQIIGRLPNGVLVAGSDSRTDGCAIGY